MTTPAELDARIEELTVDAYGDDEQASGFLVGAREALVPAESATIRGWSGSTPTTSRPPLPMRCSRWTR
jgi:hypothetical protein